MRVLYFGTYRRNYSRNKILIEGLRRNNVEVIECHQPLWSGVEDRVKIASGGWRKLGFWKRIVSTYAKLLAEYFRIKDYDVIICGYPGQLDVILAWILSKLKRKPLVWDVFMSTYLISLERGLDKKSRISVTLIHLLEYLALQLPDLLIQDTKEYEEWLQKSYGLSNKRFELVPTGANNIIFFPRESSPRSSSEIKVLYYGTFIPNHGVDVIVKAAQILSQKKEIVFVFIGDGPEKNKSEQFINIHNMANVRFLGWLEQEDVVEYIEEADICLGVFGNTPQSLMTVQNKIFECLAMKRPVITGDSATIRSYFTHGEHLHICARNPYALANAITTLAEDSSYRSYIAERGYEYYKKNFTVEQIGSIFKNHLEKMNRKKN